MRYSSPVSSRHSFLHWQHKEALHANILQQLLTQELVLQHHILTMNNPLCLHKLKLDINEGNRIPYRPCPRWRMSLVTSRKIQSGTCLDRVHEQFHGPLLLHAHTALRCPMLYCPLHCNLLNAGETTFHGGLPSHLVSCTNTVPILTACDIHFSGDSRSSQFPSLGRKWKALHEFVRTQDDRHCSFVFPVIL